MTNILLQTLDTIAVTQSTSTINTSLTSSLWFWLALVEFLFIVVLFLMLISKRNNMSKENFEKIKEHKNNKIDTGDLVNSIFKSKSIFKELSKKYHPDKYLNTKKYNIALNIYQEITNNKNDYKKLKELEKEAIEKLK